MQAYLATVRTGRDGFKELAKIWASLAHLEDHEIWIDCSKLSWFDAHMASPLMIICRKLERKGNKIFFQKMNESTEKILHKNGFLKEHYYDVYGTTIALNEFSPNDSNKFSEYVSEKLKRQDMPKMSHTLERKFFEGIDEIFNNSVLHSKSSVWYNVCGQFFPKKHKLSLAISDGGIGFSRNYQNAYNKQIRDDEAIDWAIKAGHTTRVMDIPGGLGLDVIREFICINKGRFIIVSGCGYWEETHKGPRKELFSNPFPGTVVILEIKTNDSYVYDLDVNIDPDSIF